MSERGLIVGDVIHLLRGGFVHEEGEQSDTPGFFKYTVEGTTPNSGGRSVAMVVIPSPNTDGIKILTIMWLDEK